MNPSQSETYLKAAQLAFAQAYPGSKPKITLSFFPDGDVQVFLAASEHSTSSPSAIGTAKSLEDAAVALMKNLAKHLREIKRKDDRDLADTMRNRYAFHARLEAAAYAVDPIQVDPFAPKAEEPKDDP
jgi:hypothetical protein